MNAAVENCIGMSYTRFVAYIGEATGLLSIGNVSDGFTLCNSALPPFTRQCGAGAEKDNVSEFWGLPYFLGFPLMHTDYAATTMAAVDAPPPVFSSAEAALPVRFNSAVQQWLPYDFANTDTSTNAWWLLPDTANLGEGCPAYWVTAATKMNVQPFTDVYLEIGRAHV